MAIKQKLKDLDKFHDEVREIVLAQGGCSEGESNGKQVLYTRGAQAICKVLDWVCIIEHQIIENTAMGHEVIVKVGLHESHEIIGMGLGAASSDEAMFQGNDAYLNAMVKMASNRALVAAVITTGALGKFFTQDVPAPKEQKPKPKPEITPQERVEHNEDKVKAKAEKKPEVELHYEGDDEPFTDSEKQKLKFWSKAFPDTVIKFTDGCSLDEVRRYQYTQIEKTVEAEVAAQMKKK